MIKYCSETVEWILSTFCLESLIEYHCSKNYIYNATKIVIEIQDKTHLDNREMV